MGRGAAIRFSSWWQRPVRLLRQITTQPAGTYWAPIADSFSASAALAALAAAGSRGRKAVTMSLCLPQKEHVINRIITR